MVFLLKDCQCAKKKQHKKLLYIAGCHEGVCFGRNNHGKAVRLSRLPHDITILGPEIRPCDFIRFVYMNTDDDAFVCYVRCFL